jgi:hypothetical protein
MRNELLREADLLWPLFERKVRAIVDAAAGYGGGGASVDEHDIGGSKHKGQLRDDQAPQFLKRDGTRSITGNLAMGVGVTIDGMDPSAHVADPNAHHARQHNIIGASDHTVSGTTLQLVGLTGPNTPGLLTPSATPGASTIVRTDAASAVQFVDVTVTSDLFVNGFLDFGTDTMYEDGSYLQVSGTKPLNFAQTVRASGWSMTPAGALTAASGAFSGVVSADSLTVTGAATVGQNLFAAATAFRVLHHTHDYPHAHVIINPGGSWSFDEQFGLDVDDNLLVRGWIVGKHAIQLPGATMILHFDGPQPFERNFGGELTGHMGQVGTAIGGLAFRPGKFDSKALQTGAATTNLVSNPSFENNVTDGWTTAVTGTGGAFVRDTARSYVGGASARITATSGGNYTIRSNAISLANNESVTVQCVMRRGSYINAQLQLRDVTNGSNRATASPTLIDTWEQLTCSWTNTTGSTVSVELRISNTHSDGAGRIWVDACQMEKSAYMTPYVDGSMGGGFAWSGTAHNSSSTQAAAHVTYLPTGVVAPSAGTIMAWVETAGITGIRQYIADPGGIGADGMYLSLESDGKPRFYYSSSGGAGVTLTAAAAVTPNVWTHVAATWGPTGAALYVNGVVAATDSTPAGGTTINAAIAIGRRFASAANWFNGWIDDVVFAGRAVSADEVRAIYESNAPVFAETSTWHWRSGRNRVWADTEGLWMLSAGGNGVIGAYAGDDDNPSATKSWGGFNLAEGDIVLGHNVSGSSAILWKRSTGKFGFYGNGNGTAQVEIGTDGSLLAAEGKIKMDATGLHVFNAASAEKIIISQDGAWFNAGGARSEYGIMTSGARARFGVVSGSNEIFGANSETYTDGSSIERIMAPLVVRSNRSAGVGCAWLELAAEDRASVPTQTSKITMASGLWVPGYTGPARAWGVTNLIDIESDTIQLNTPTLRLAGLTTSTAAVGAYAGKIKVKIGGTDRWIPYYAS